MAPLQFYSNGKLLITGEYLVMKGARALAVPLKTGQSMQVKVLQSEQMIRFRTDVLGKHWFDAVFKMPGLDVMETSDQAKAVFLRNLISAASAMNPTVLRQAPGFEIRSDVFFPMNYGFGSSSSLTANIAAWFAVAPLALHFKVSKGSGYDVACALAKTPLFYRLSGKSPLIEAVDFRPSFHAQLYFVYLGRKQDSAESIRFFEKALIGRDAERNRISKISIEMTKADDLNVFIELMEEHEALMSKVLGLERVKEKHFSDFQGAVKSLGAWGGDFVLMAWAGSSEELKSYLHTKNLRVMIPFQDIVLNEQEGNS